MDDVFHLSVGDGLAEVVARRDGGRHRRTLPDEAVGAGDQDDLGDIAARREQADAAPQHGLPGQRDQQFVAAAEALAGAGGSISPNGVPCSLASVSSGRASFSFKSKSASNPSFVPSTMELLGDWNWWLPGWLDQILPRINVESSTTLEQELEAMATEEGSPVS